MLNLHPSAERVKVLLFFSPFVRLQRFFPFLSSFVFRLRLLSRKKGFETQYIHFLLPLLFRLPPEQTYSSILLRTYEVQHILMAQKMKSSLCVIGEFSFSSSSFLPSLFLPAAAKEQKSADPSPKIGPTLPFPLPSLIILYSPFPF